MGELNKKILVVDNGPVMRQLISYLLKLEGYKVFEASEAEEALDKLSKGLTTDLIILDLAIPVMGGVPFIKSLREMQEHRFTPVLIMAAAYMEEQNTEARRAGATGWITKPFTAEQLREAARLYFFERNDDNC